MENKRNKNTIENTPVLKFLLIDIQNHEYQNIKIDKNDKTTSRRRNGKKIYVVFISLN